MDASDNQTSVPADWYADPTARHQYRYWDGTRWTDQVADDGQASIDPVDASGTRAEGPQHAIVLLTNQASGGSTQYILTDTTKADLEQRLRGSQLAIMLDIKDDEQIEEFLSRGVTETSGVMGQKQTVTIEWCTCDDPASHKREQAAQLGS